MRDLRVKRGLTKTALAKPRYTVSFVSQIEAGRRRPSPSALEYFAERLGVSRQFLLTGVPDDAEQQLGYRMEEIQQRLREGDVDDAGQLIEEASDLAQRSPTRFARERLMMLQAEHLLRTGRFEDAVDRFEQVLEAKPPASLAGKAVVGLATAYRTVGDLSYAAQVVEAFLGEGEREPLEPALAAQLQCALVGVYFERGDLLRAERAAARALAAAASSSSLEVKAGAYWDASRVLAERRRWDEALDYATRASVLMEELDEQRHVGRIHVAYAFICLEADGPRLKEARRHLAMAEKILRRSGTSDDLAYLHEERGKLALLEGRPEDALDEAENVLEQARHDEVQRGRGLLLKARALAALQRDDDAFVALEEAVATFKRVGARTQEADGWKELAEIHVRRGETAAAVEALRAAVETLERKREPVRPRDPATA